MLHLILISLDLADLQHEYSTAFISFFLGPNIFENLRGNGPDPNERLAKRMSQSDPTEGNHTGH